MVKLRFNIWSNGLTKVQNVGTRLNNLMAVAISAPESGSTHHKIFSRVNIENSIFKIQHSLDIKSLKFYFSLITYKFTKTSPFFIFFFKCTNLNLG